MRSAVISGFLALMSFSAFGNPQAQYCLSAREYITTLEYIRDHKEFILTEPQSRELADKVSLGCLNSSKRFINVTDVLLKAGMPSQKALETGLRFANHDDDAAAAFLAVFKGSFMEKLLDLDLHTSLETALSLSESFEGNRKMAFTEFNKLIVFCLDKKQLDLPLVQCAKLASRVIRSGDEFENKVGETFIDVFHYLTKANKANLPTFEALEVSEEVVKYGPEAKRNFIQSYEYGLDQKGLGLSNKQAIDFGKTMASRSVKKKLESSSDQKPK